MGLRFRKSFKIAPGFRMNLSGSGASFSAGPRGASVSVGKRGAYFNAGLPGTGLSARQRLDGPAARTASKSGKETVSMAVSIGVREDGELYFKGPDGLPLADGLAKVVKKQHGEAIAKLIQTECDQINAEVEAVGKLHLGTPEPQNRPVFTATEFPLPYPELPAPKKLGFFRALFRSQRDANDAINQAAQTGYEAQVQEWEQQLASHKLEEARRREHIEELIYSDVAAMDRHLEAVLQGVAWPRETSVSTEVLLGGKLVFIDVDLPEIEDMPSKRAEVPQRGMKLSVKQLSPTQVQRLYMQHVHAIAFRIVGETFAALPEAQTVCLSGYSQRPDKATGQLKDDYLLSVKVDRSAWHEIQFFSLAQLEVTEALDRFELRRNMSKTGVFKPVVPFAVEDFQPA